MKAKEKALKYAHNNIEMDFLTKNEENHFIKCLDIALQEQAREIFNWSEIWFDNKRKNNDMWRVNQDELTSMFLEELNKYLEGGRE